ncbi:MAG: potassium-transporting ATPase subunit KdpC [Anaerostipes sp.]|nr:potassium-transporting ATPase subunit KdpC [Anaerostipes sp.]
MKLFKKTVGVAAGLLLVMTVLCGIIYTAVITGFGNLLFPNQVNGSIIEVDGVKYGSELLAQEFSDEKHMWGRVMNVSTTMFQDKDGNYKMYSTPSNLSPKSKEFKDIVDERVDMILEANSQSNTSKIPVDLVTCSGSGLDPDISVAAAKYQVPRIAKNNHLTEDKVNKMIEACTTKKVLGMFGESTVNVLKVNLMLEGILK